MPDLIRRLQRPPGPRRPLVQASPRTWAIRIGLAALGGWLLYSFVFSDQGILRILSMRREAARIEARSRLLAANVRQVDDELQRVHHDPFYLEKYLRENAGLVRPGEIVYKVVPESVAAQAIQARALVLPPLPKGPKGLPPGAPRR